METIFRDLRPQRVDTPSQYELLLAIGWTIEALDPKILFPSNYKPSQNSLLGTFWAANRSLNSTGLNHMGVFITSYNKQSEVR